MEPSGSRIKPEIMSPVGYWPQLHAAIEAGADAVYFGLKHFTARAKVGFVIDELPEVMRTLHRRGVRGYVTFNTLVFDHEIRAAAQSLAAIAGAGVDAIIVQDIGIAHLAAQLAPELEIHGSTQMSITSAEGVEHARRYGVSRVVLARELALGEIRAIKAATDCELEVFVHGALCVSYSGQCFSSEAWGGRSANRGQCAQACRLPYELLVDERVRPLGEARYLLSPGDLYALDVVPELVEIGVSALKIEGRYKDASYVALTTKAYREAVDAAWAGLPPGHTRQTKQQLEQAYSRGLGPYFISGTDHQAVVQGRAPRHRGVFAGQVARLEPDRVVIELAEDIALKAGDGIVFDAAAWRSPEEREEGGRIYTVTPQGATRVALGFGAGAIDMRRIRVGDWIWRTSDPELEKAVRPILQAQAPIARQPVAVRVSAHEGQPLTAEWWLINQPQQRVVVASPEPTPPSRSQGLDGARVREQFGRLGNTAYRLEELELETSGAPFVPTSLLNSLRREAVAALEAQQDRLPERAIQDADALVDAALGRRAAPEPAVAGPVALHVLVRTPEQLEAALEVRPASITLDYLELYGLKPAVEQIQAAGIEARVASPRVLKPSEQRIVRFLEKLGCAIVVRSAGLLEAFQERRDIALIGDFSLNAANVLSSDLLLDMGLARITPTHDLNAEQIAALARELGSERIEAVAYQHLPVFHTEHCVFCRFLSSGTSFKDCGHPCEKHRVALRDHQGREHPVMADVGCRNTIFGAEAQEASRHLEAWRAAGIRHLRLEFVHETKEQAAEVIAAFAAAGRGELSAVQLQQRLRAALPQGTTAGSLFVPDDYLVVPLMS